MPTLRLALLPLMAAALLASDPAPPVSDAGAVLFAGWPHYSLGHPTAERLAKAGYRTQGGRHPDLGGAALTLARLKRYHCVVVGGLGKANGDLTLNDLNRANNAALRQYLDESGGVVVLLAYCQQAAVVPLQLDLLEPLGCHPRFNTVFADPDQRPATAWRIPFAWTDRLSGPLTVPCDEMVWRQLRVMG